MWYGDPDRLLLQLKIENYKRARDAASESERQGCDELIKHAESQLRALASSRQPSADSRGEIERGQDEKSWRPEEGHR